MAKVFPSDWRTLEKTGAAAREIETLALLEQGLPDRLNVFHGVHWTRVEHDRAVFGEIDFVIVSADARVLLIEQKSARHVGDDWLRGQGHGKAAESIRTFPEDMELAVFRIEPLRDGTGLQSAS